MTIVGPADNSKMSAERAGGHSAERAGDSKVLLVASLADDLAAETADLLPHLSGLGEAYWDAATPAAGWTIRDQVTHLAFFDDASLLSLRDRDAFIAQAAELHALGERFPNVVAEQHRHLPGGYCLEWLASSRAGLIGAYKTADPSVRLPWYGLDFSVPAAITGRLMETWAHGQDIADTIGVTRQPTARLRHVATIGIRARAFSFASRGLDVPAKPVYVELAGPAPARGGDPPEPPALGGHIPPDPPTGGKLSPGPPLWGSRPPEPRPPRVAVVPPPSDPRLPYPD